MWKVIASSLVILGCGQYVTKGELDAEIENHRAEHAPSPTASPGEGCEGCIPSAIPGPIGPQGDVGPKGSTGPAGSAGKSYTPTTISVAVDRSSTPWDSSNSASVPRRSVIFLPSRFQVLALGNTSNPQGGWIDVRIEDGPIKYVYCYQRQTNSYWYELSYKKQQGSTLGCDSNSEKDTGAWSSDLSVPNGVVLRVIPRCPKMASIGAWSFSVAILMQEP